MSIRVRNRRAVVAAASVAALIGLAACGPTTEPTGKQGESSETAPAAGGEAGPSSSPSGQAADEPSAGSSDSATPNDDPGVTASPTASAAASATASAGDRTDAEDNDPALCDAADLSGSIEDLRGGATAGSVYRGLTVSNTSDENCVLLGLPGVSYVEHAEGAPLGSPAVFSDAQASVSIDLAPGDTAVATLKQTNAQNYGEQCDLVPAKGLRVYPPSAFDSLFIEQNIAACANDAIELMSVEAFQPAR